MPLQIDHAVVLVRDLDQASADYEQAGFRVTPGGQHADGLTHNALIPFADGAYLELLAFAQPDVPQPHRWWPRLARGEELGDFAVLSDDLAGEITAWQARGLAVQGPQAGGRIRPDGQPVAWRLALFDDAERDGLPFVIQDVTPRDLRVPGGAAAQHPNGATGVAGLRIGAADVTAAATRYATLLGAASQPTSLGARFGLGPHWLDVVPRRPTGIVALHLRGGDRAVTPAPERLHGAAIVFGG